MPTQSASARHTVHQLLFRALLEIRSQGHEEKNKVVFHLADLFHNIVLEMERAVNSLDTFDEVLRHLEDRAREKGLERWLNTNLGQIAETELPPRTKRRMDKGNGAKGAKRSSQTK